MFPQTAEARRAPLPRRGSRAAKPPAIPAPPAGLGISSKPVEGAQRNLKWPRALDEGVQRTWLLAVLLLMPQAVAAAATSGVSCSETSPLLNHCTAGTIAYTPAIHFSLEDLGFVGHVTIRAQDLDDPGHGVRWECDVLGSQVLQGCSNAWDTRPPNEGDTLLVTCVTSALQQVPGVAPTPVGVVGPLGPWTCLVQN